MLGGIAALLAVGASIVTILGGPPESVEHVRRWLGWTAVVEEAPFEPDVSAEDVQTEVEDESSQKAPDRPTQPQLDRPAAGAAVVEVGSKPDGRADVGIAHPRTGAAHRQAVKESEAPVDSAIAFWPAGSRAGEARRNPKDGLYYVWVPGGSFRFGCSPGDDFCEDDEKPARAETVKGFWLGRTEATVRAYKSVVRSLPVAPSFNAGWIDEAQPMVRVTLSEAMGFCASVASRLPNEVEWEYAARAGEKRSVPARLSEAAWFSDNSRGEAHSVSQKQPNAFGLYDMLGNAGEWVLPAASPDASPDASRGVLRGGSWRHDARFTRYSFRLVDSPGRREEMYGFRCLAAAGP